MPNYTLNCTLNIMLIFLFSQVKGDLDTLKQFVVSYNDQYDYDTTEDWEYRWTFAKALLFTVTIITTIGT